MMARKPYEVIEFHEPVYYKKPSKEVARERKKFLIGNVSDIFEITPVADNKESRTRAESSELNLKEVLKEVDSLAFSNLTCPKAKRRAEEHQLKALGAKPSKSDYVPYPHYQMVVKSKKDKERKIAEELKISQKKKRRKILLRGKGRWKDSIKSLEPGMGKFKNGVLKLSKKELTKYSR